MLSTQLKPSNVQSQHRSLSQRIGVRLPGMRITLHLDHLAPVPVVGSFTWFAIGSARSGQEYIDE